MSAVPSTPLCIDPTLLTTLPDFLLGRDYIRSLIALFLTIHLLSYLRWILMLNPPLHPPFLRLSPNIMMIMMKLIQLRLHPLHLNCSVKIVTIAKPSLVNDFKRLSI